MLVHDVVIVGAGLAGMRAAAGAAQGGVNAALGDDDSWEPHTFDTVKGSDYLGDQDTCEIMCKEAPGEIIWLEHMGCVFSRVDSGRIAQRPFGGAGFPRTAYAADITGHVMLHTMYEQIMRRGVTVYDEWFVPAIVVEDGRCRGVMAMDLRTGRMEAIRAKAVVLAPGGLGRVYYGFTANAHVSTGDGMAVAYRAGAALADMEFIQFHPTTMKADAILVTEGARGE